MRSVTRSAFLGAALLLAMTSVVSAQEVQLTGPLAGAPAIKRQVLRRSGRLHMAILPTFTINDEYVRHLMGGARLEYNVADFLAFGVWGSYTAFTVTNGLTDEIQDRAFSNGE